MCHYDVLLLHHSHSDFSMHDDTISCVIMTSFDGITQVILVSKLCHIVVMTRSCWCHMCAMTQMCHLLLVIVMSQLCHIAVMTRSCWCHICTLAPPRAPSRVHNRANTLVQCHSIHHSILAKWRTFEEFLNKLMTSEQSEQKKSFLIPTLVVDALRSPWFSGSFIIKFAGHHLRLIG